MNNSVIAELELTRDEKKSSGQFYTPETIVDYMVESLDFSRDSTILDSSCGCGVFLIKSFLYLKNKYNTSEVIKNIYGIDINERAVDYTRNNLINLAGNKYKNIVYNNIRVGNSIQTKVQEFKLAKELPQIIKDGGFDFIIGNPPYVTITDSSSFDREYPVYSKTINGVVNAASLMTATGYELLKNGGVLSFLLPKSLSRVKSYAKLRKFLLENTQILQIFDLGLAFNDVRGEQIILSFRKQIPTHNFVSIRRYLNISEELRTQPEVKIKQQEYSSYDNFLILDDKELYNLADKLKKISKTLDSLCNGLIFRGISVPHNIQKESKTSLSDIPVVTGSMIKKFMLSKKHYVAPNDIPAGFQNKLQSLLVKKIMLQNIYSAESGIKAVYDCKGVISGETVTNIIVEAVDPKYMLGLLNSKLVTFFLTYIVFNGSLLTMHTDKEYIGRIPIVLPNQREQASLISLVDEITRKPDLAKEHLHKIDELVYKIYGIDNPTAKKIDLMLREIMSKRSYW